MADSISIDVKIKAVEDAASLEKVAESFNKALSSGIKASEIFKPFETESKSFVNALRGNFQDTMRQMYDNLASGTEKMQSLFDGIELDFAEEPVYELYEALNQLESKYREMSWMAQSGLINTDNLDELAQVEETFENAAMAAQSMLPADVFNDILAISNAMEDIPEAASRFNEALETAAREGADRGAVAIRERLAQAADGFTLPNIAQAFDRIPEEARPAIDSLRQQFEDAVSDLQLTDIFDEDALLNDADNAFAELRNAIEETIGSGVNISSASGIDELRGSLPELANALEEYNRVLFETINNRTNESFAEAGSEAVNAAQTIAEASEQIAGVADNANASGEAVNDLARAFQQFYNASSSVDELSTSFDAWRMQSEALVDATEAQNEALDEAEREYWEQMEAADAAADAERKAAEEAEKAGKKSKKAAKDLSPLEQGFKKLAKAALAFFSIKKVFDLGKQMLELSSQAVDLQVTVNGVFGDMADDINEFADSALQSFGITSSQAKNFATSIGGMVKGFGVGNEAAAEMGIGIAKLAADFGTFTEGLDPDKAFEALQSGLSGNARALKKYGVDLSDANLENYRLAQGIAVSYKEMDAASKATLRYNYILESLSNVQGAAAQRAGSWSSQTSLLKGQLQELGSVLGGLLQNILTPILVVINQILSAAISGAKAIAKMFGFDLETVMSNQGLTGAGAGVAMADGMDELTDSTDEATDAQKKLNAAQKKGLANIHQLNVLQDNSSSGSGDSATAGAGTVNAGLDLAKYANIDVVSKKTDSWLDNMLDGLEKVAKRIKELVGYFNKGFKIGLGDANFNGVVDNLKRAWESVKRIWDSTFGSDYFKIIVDNIFFNLGRIFGNITSIALTISEFITGTIAKFLEDNELAIEFDITNVLEQFDSWIEILADLSEALDIIFSSLTSDGAIGTAANALGILYDIFSSILYVVTNLTVDITNLFALPIIENAEGIKGVLDGIFEVTEKVTAAVKRLSDQFREGIIKLYDEHIHPLMESFAQGWSEIVGALVDGWNKHIKPILDGLAERFEDVIDNHVSPALSKFMEFLGNVADLVKIVWETWLVPFLSWLSGVFTFYIGSIVSEIGSVVASLSETFSNVFGDIITILNGFVVWLQGIFTGDVDKVLDGLVDMIRGFVNLGISLFEGFCNYFIDGINSIINALNTIQVDIPDWVPFYGGDKFGINLPNVPRMSLPRLAQGAVIPPNNEFMAVLGDQRRGVNIETPLDTMVGAFKQALTDMAPMLGGVQQVTIPVYVNNELTTTQVVRLQDMARYRNGGL